jgi:hypothetical protein
MLHIASILSSPIISTFAKADRAAGTPAELQQTTVNYVRQRYTDETAEGEIVEDRTKVSTSGPLYTNGQPSL